jgi:hypothetical protein
MVTLPPRASESPLSLIDLDLGIGDDGASPEASFRLLPFRQKTWATTG